MFSQPGSVVEKREKQQQKGRNFKGEQTPKMETIVFLQSNLGGYMPSLLSYFFHWKQINKPIPHGRGRGYTSR